MDPSYNNNFGSSANGANMTPASSGDIVLSAPAPQKKSKKWLVPVVLVVVLVVLGIGFLIFSQFSGESVQSSSAKKVYNSYVNYILLGKDSDEDLDEDVVIAQSPYFYSLSDDQKTNYVEVADKKYAELKNNYDGKKDLAVLKSFYQDFVKIQPLEMNEMVKVYSNSGRNGVEKLIKEHYAVDSDEQYLQNYISAEIALAGTMLDEIENADKIGCVVNRQLKDGCYTNTEEEENKYSNGIINEIEATEALSLHASETLINLYKEIYGIIETEEE